MLAALVATLVVVGGFAGYLWQSQIAGRATGSNIAGDTFGLSSFSLVLGAPGCYCDNLSLTVVNRAANPITGVDISDGHEFYGVLWSSGFPLGAGDSISGSLRKIPATLNNPDTFLVTAYFEDGNATTVGYLWPEGSSGVFQVQTNCCRDLALNSSCNLTPDNQQIAKLLPLVEKSSAFVSLEEGNNYSLSYSECSQGSGVHTVSLGFDYTPPQELICGIAPNSDWISVDLVLTPTGYSIPSMILQGGVSQTWGITCTSSSTTVISTFSTTV